MDYENFKEELIEGLKENFETRGIEGMSFIDQGHSGSGNFRERGPGEYPDGRCESSR